MSLCVVCSSVNSVDLFRVSWLKKYFSLNFLLNSRISCKSLVGCSLCGVGIKLRHLESNNVSPGGVYVCLSWWCCGWWPSWTFSDVLPFLQVLTLGAWSILMALFFLFNSWVVSVEMLSIISCILVHCVGEVSSLVLFLMGSSSSLSLWHLSIQYSLNAWVRFNPVSCWIPSHSTINFPGV